MLLTVTGPMSPRAERKEALAQALLLAISLKPDLKLAVGCATQFDQLVIKTIPVSQLELFPFGSPPDDQASGYLNKALKMMLVINKTEEMITKSDGLLMFPESPTNHSTWFPAKQAVRHDKILLVVPIGFSKTKLPVMGNGSWKEHGSYPGAYSWNPKYFAH